MDRNIIMTIVDQRVQAELSKAGISTVSEKQKTSQFQYRFDHDTGSFASGLSRIKKKDFIKQFSRYPILPNNNDDEDVLIIYNQAGAFPSSNYFGVQYDVGEIPLFHDIEEATQNCVGFNVVPIKIPLNGNKSQCLAIVGQYESYHNLHFEKKHYDDIHNDGTDSNLLFEPVSWYGLKHKNMESDEGNGRFENNHYDHILKFHWSCLQMYLSRLEDNLSRLEKLLSSSSSSSTDDDDAKNKLVIATTCCHSDTAWLDLFHFLCLLQQNNRQDGPQTQNHYRFLIFATDTSTYKKLQIMGQSVFYDDSWTDDNETTTIQNDTAIRRKEEYTKITGMHLLSLLNHDILFLPNLTPRSNPLQIIKNQINDHASSLSSSNHDVVIYNIQSHVDDSMDSWYIRHTPETKYLLTSLLYSSDKIVFWSNFQTVFHHLLQEHSSLFNLQIIISNIIHKDNISNKMTCQDQIWNDRIHTIKG